VDRRHFGFFGGAQLIQQGILSRKQTRDLALLLAATAWGFVLGLALLVGSLWLIALYAGLLGLAWAYSCRPLALSYRGYGEAVVFLLFGPTTFWGGCFLQTGSLPGGTGILLSMVHGALVAAILVTNEVADARPDSIAGKMTLVAKAGAHNGWLLSAFLAISALGVIVWLLCQGRVHRPTALIAVMGGAAACALSVLQLRRLHNRRECLTTASKLAIAAHTWTSLWLMAGTWA
jgi:1,4-dihydroxy-2-naphthoate octaprenyltransferase